ncbi:MAG: rhomboid family intramembrane serine protease [Lachnospiraceae bacterium]|nr:rhomboid family intramembrane serine protease [Lachnospiraceae bacterium]
MGDSVQKDTLAARLGRYFAGRGFQRVETHTDTMEIYYIPSGDSVNLIWMVMPDAVEEMTAEQYRKRLDTIFRTFSAGPYSNIHTLTLFFTKNPEKARELGTDTPFWTVDEFYGRLIIYENQMEDFLGIRSVIEQNLHFGADIRNADGMQKAGVLEASRKSVSQGAVKKSGTVTSLGEFRRSIRAKTSDTPYISIALVAINVFVFFLQSFHRELQINGANSWIKIENNQEYYRLFTCMFLHGSIDHLVNNMLSLFVFGSILEKNIGHWKYMVAYFLSGLTASVASCAYYKMMDQPTVSVGASGAIFGIMGVFLIWLILTPSQREQVTPVRIGLFLFLTLYQLGIFQGISPFESSIDYAAHVGGFVFGTIFGLILMWIRNIRKRRRI